MVNGEDISSLVTRFPLLLPSVVSRGVHPAAKFRGAAQGFIACFMVFSFVFCFVFFTVLTRGAQ